MAGEYKRHPLSWGMRNASPPSESFSKTFSPAKSRRRREEIAALLSSIAPVVSARMPSFKPITAQKRAVCVWQRKDSLNAPWNLKRLGNPSQENATGVIKHSTKNCFGGRVVAYYDHSWVRTFSDESLGWGMRDAG